MRQSRRAYADGKEKMDKFYRQSVARCCRESGMFVQARAEAWRTRRSRHEARVWNKTDRIAVATQMRHAFWQASSTER